MKYRTRAAFTVLELLVVIAIVGVLVAILTPLLSAAWKSANATRCANNLRNIGAGFNAYASESRGQIPGGHTLERTASNWAGAVANYFAPQDYANHRPLAEVSVLACPSHPLSGLIETGYTMNHVPSNVRPSAPTAGASAQLGRVAKPAERIWFIDSADDFNGWGAWMMPNPPPGLSQPNGDPVPDPVYFANMHLVATGAHLPNGSQRTVASSRHGRLKANSLFYDGHVALIDTSSLSMNDFNPFAEP